MLIRGGTLEEEKKGNVGNLRELADKQQLSRMENDLFILRGWGGLTRHTVDTVGQ